jgi:hypothetical protein
MTDGSTRSKPICSQLPGGESMRSTSASVPFHWASTELVVPKSIP